MSTTYSDKFELQRVALGVAIFLALACGQSTESIREQAPAAATSHNTPSPQFQAKQSPVVNYEIEDIPTPYMWFWRPERSEELQRFMYRELVGIARDYYDKGDVSRALLIARRAGRARFVKKGELWFFPRNELTRLYAWSAFRLGLQTAAEYDARALEAHYKAKPWIEPDPVYFFCVALSASPEDVRKAIERYSLSDNAKPLFDKAERYCGMPGGFRTRSMPPDEPDDTWWVLRLKLPAEQIADLIRQRYARADYVAARLFWENAGKERVERVSGAWAYRDVDINRYAALSEFHLAADLDDTLSGTIGRLGRLNHPFQMPYDSSWSLHQAAAFRSFCFALRVASESTQEAATRTALKPWLAAMFERAKGDPECHATAPFRSRAAFFPDP